MLGLFTYQNPTKCHSEVRHRSKQVLSLPKATRPQALIPSFLEHSCSGWRHDLQTSRECHLRGVISSQMNAMEFEFWQNVIPPDVISTGHRRS